MRADAALRSDVPGAQDHEEIRMMHPPIEFRFRRVPSIRRIEERCRRHAHAILPATESIERCEVVVSRAPGAGPGPDPYEIRVEVRRAGGEVLVDQASAVPAGSTGNDEELLVQTVGEALHRMRRRLARAERASPPAPSLAGSWRPAPWSTHSAGSGEIWYG